MTMQIVEVSGAEYFSDEQGWATAMHASDADPLFMSYAWQRSWWDAFATRLPLETCFLEARIGDRTVGRLALVRRRVRVRGWPIRSLELMGNLWHGPSTLRTELLDVLACRDHARQVTSSFIDHLAADGDWGQLVMLDVAANSSLGTLATSGAFNRAHATDITVEPTWTVRTGAGLLEFAQALSPGSRRRLFGQRRKLAALGPIRLQFSTLEDTSALEVLDRLHGDRFGGRLLGGGRAAFLAQLSRRLPDGAVRISTLSVGDRPVSALLNVRLGSVEYNIQGGFDAAYCRGMSPGKLHWGMMIEHACNQGDDVTFELLAGKGHTDDFKAEFAQPGRTLVSRRWVRQPVLAVAYRMRDAWRQR